MDADEVRAAAETVRRLADELGALAARAAAASDVAWRSASADRFRARLAAESAHLREAAASADEAAAALRSHATDLDTNPLHHLLPPALR